MGSLGGIVSGAFALVVLETVVSSDRATSGIASLLQVPGQWARSFLDPTKPLVPNYAHAQGIGNVSLSDALSAAVQPVSMPPPVTTIPDPSTLPPPATQPAATPPPTSGPPRVISV